MLIELRQAFILYQDYHMLLLTLAGQYTVRFSRGHGTDLTKAVTVTPPAGSGAAAEARGPLVLSEFPSRWVEGHGVTVEACVEGTTDVIPPGTNQSLGGFSGPEKNKTRPSFLLNRGLAGTV